jgi:hypothetical protein
MVESKGPPSRGLCKIARASKRKATRQPSGRCATGTLGLDSVDEAVGSALLEAADAVCRSGSDWQFRSDAAATPSKIRFTHPGYRLVGATTTVSPDTRHAFLTMEIEGGVRDSSGLVWYVSLVRVPATSRLKRGFPSATLVALGAALFQCNTYSADLLRDEPVEADPEPAPDADDDTPAPFVTVGPPADCPELPCGPSVEPPGPDPVEPGVEPSANPVSPIVPNPSVEPDPTLPEPDVAGAGGTAPNGSGGSAAGGSGEPNGGMTSGPTGGGGTSGSGSTGGVPEPGPEPDGGAGAPVVVVPDPVSPGLIENFEDGNNALLRNGERRGYWYTSGGPEGMITPTSDEFETEALDPPNPMLDDSEQALHVIATDFSDTDSYAVAGVALNQDGDEKLSYADAAMYAGISFWARSGSAEPMMIAFRIPTTSTEVDADHFGVEMEIAPEWTLYGVPFDDRLEQQGFGDPQTFDPAEIEEIQFALAPGETGFDIVIDDIEFLESIP